MSNEFPELVDEPCGYDNEEVDESYSGALRRRSRARRRSCSCRSRSRSRSRYSGALPRSLGYDLPGMGRQPKMHKHTGDLSPLRHSGALPRSLGYEMPGMGRQPKMHKRT